MSESTAYDELCAYTLARGDSTFIHQHVVDAFAAQQADEETKPISLTFSLLGLYLHLENHLTGRQVQRAHQFLARREQPWPSFALPHDRGSMTAADVLAQPPGSARDEAIHGWCASVWQAHRDNQKTVRELWDTYGKGCSAF